MTHSVHLQNVRKVYRIGKERVVAIDDISVSVKTGEICCLLGTSGSGKSTLLNLMAGLEKPTKGLIEVNGIRIDSLNERQLARFRQNYVGFIFQSYNLLPTLTALENVSLPLTFRDVPKKIREEKAAEMLKAVGLEKYILHKPSQMSGGQQQRVGIARAFVSKPPIIFADEPTGNLDSKTTEDVIQLMLRIANENGQTLMIVTHDQHIATYANRIIRIADGNIVSEEYQQREIV
ncbi:macrolide ABC transporter ATP-binding protein [Desulfuribacillus stibiiarsenatis]|uniref:Macrolide ABC transporter ATP-binding protein n=1 Tax=Desulfuribacillus stibiiarsenatis TaxID=1390249 RepID=A0A1E5LAC3_9FIRM|nr:macrolide ABC transporter ATP-binding protein [Desulfuribacillus stibiiarsenatis]